MSCREEYLVEEFRLVDSEGRHLGILFDATFELEWDDDDAVWNPVACRWTDSKGDNFWAVSWSDPAKTTWWLITNSWEAGGYDTKVADTVDAPEPEFEEA